jgi:hypothetical protein
LEVPAVQFVADAVMVGSPRVAPDPERQLVLDGVSSFILLALPGGLPRGEARIVVHFLRVDTHALELADCPVLSFRR